MARAAHTNLRKCGLSSGAPPVMSRVGRRFLAAVRAGTDVAVHAGLVAAIADIDLERVEAAALNRRKGNLTKPRPGIAHRARSIFATQIRIACGARHVDWHGPRTKSREDIWRRRSAKRVGVALPKPCAPRTAAATRANAQFARAG